MSMFGRRRKKQMPELNMSSMPDMIFTVLFFFMIVTNMREVQLKVEYKVPQGKELERLTKKSSVTYIHIGRPPEYGGNDSEMCIQMNDRLVETSDIVSYLTEERSRMAPEDMAGMSVCIKADRDTPMGIIMDVKQAIREADILNIVYFADNKDK